MFLAPGTFECFQGTLGAGKTLSMTRRGALAFSAGQKVYSNYECIFAEPITSLKHLLELRNAVLLLDELQTIVDSREFKNNINLTQWILIVRKLGLSILYTTQFLGQVDIRVRHVTEYVYCCEKASYYGYPATKTYLVKWQGEGGRIVRTFVMPHTQELYNLYNTYDYKVKLTRDGREASFNADSVLNGAGQVKRT